MYSDRRTAARQDLMEAIVGLLVSCGVEAKLESLESSALDAVEQAACADLLDTLHARVTALREDRLTVDRNPLLVLDDVLALLRTPSAPKVPSIRTVAVVDGRVV